MFIFSIYNKRKPALGNVKQLMKKLKTKIPLWGGVARSDGVVTRPQATNTKGVRKWMADMN